MVGIQIYFAYYHYSMMPSSQPLSFISQNTIQNAHRVAEADVKSRVSVCYTLFEGLQEKSKNVPSIFMRGTNTELTVKYLCFFGSYFDSVLTVVVIEYDGLFSSSDNFVKVEGVTGACTFGAALYP